jgi:hypothetical protein
VRLCCETDCLQLSGIGLVVAGTVIQIKYSQYINFLGDDFLSAPIVLIACGCVITLLGFFGCCGAIRENYCMTMTVSRVRFLAGRYALSLPLRSRGPRGGAQLELNFYWRDVAVVAVYCFGTESGNGIEGV